jgi:hypothetical protein
MNDHTPYPFFWLRTKTHDVEAAEPKVVVFFESEKVGF